MLQIEWIQSDSVVLNRDLDDSIFNQLSWIIEEVKASH